MRYADRVQETTTTTGTGTVTLLGAAAAYQSFTSRVQTGDVIPYLILDANGTAWETGYGTLATSSTLARTTVLQSSNSDTAISLSAGTHKVFLDFPADQISSMAVQADFQVDYMASGMRVPTSASLTAVMTAGVLYATGRRIVKPAQSHLYTASKDTYVDVSNIGLVTYVPVSNGAGAPAITANSLRVSKVVTNGSAVTSTTDLANRISVPFVQVADSGAQMLVDAGWTALTFDTNLTDNTGGSMHSTSVNPSRFPVPADGLYVGNLLFNMPLNSANTTLSGMSVNSAGTFSGGSYSGYVVPSGFGHAYHLLTTLPTPMNAGDYAEFFGFQTGASTAQPLSTGDARASLRKVG